MLSPRLTAVCAVLALFLAVIGGWVIAGSGQDEVRRHVVAAGVPLDEVHPAGLPDGARRPGVVVAHGYSGSARLMAPFGDSLAARGYVVVLLDFAGHGADTHPLPDDAAGTDASAAALDHDLDVAMAHLRSLPDVDPARVALVGHSMGATAVTRYAAAHPFVTTVVAISLPDSSVASSGRPARLLLLVGGLEFPDFHDEADTAAEAGAGRKVVTVPGVEHVSVLFAPRTHRETVAWLDESFGGPPADRPIPFPGRRAGGAVLLTLAFLLAFPFVARAALGGGGTVRRGGETVRRGGETVRRQRLDLPVIGRAVVVTSGAAVLAAVAAPRLPIPHLPLAMGGYLVGYFAVTGALLVAFSAWRRSPATGRPAAPGPRRTVPAALLLVAFAAAAIAVPLQLGVTHAVPVGARWWLLPVVWAAFAILAYGAERIGATLTVPVVAVVVLTAAAATGLTYGFVLLVVPLLAALMVWQAVWSATLNALGAPTWLVAVVGSVVVAWPMALAPPLIP